MERITNSKWKFKKINKNEFIKNRLQLRIQKFGSFMAGMIMPSIGILTAWGIWTAMFLYDYKNDVSQGWFNVKELGLLIEPGMKYLIPILIAYTAGRMVDDTRGAMISTFVVLTCIIGNDWLFDKFGDILQINGASTRDIGAPNQMIAAMTVAPLSAYVLKKISKLYISKIPPGYEMLIKTFDLALIGITFGVAAFYGWGWIMFGVQWVMTNIIVFFINYKWAYPFIALVSEPLKTVFLNNALNYGVLVPIAQQDVTQQIADGVANPGSIYYMISANCGHGLGLMLAYMCWRKSQRAAAGGAAAISFVGGISEVYYVYVLAEPVMLVSTVAGAFAGNLIFIFGAGTIAPPSPGSIIAIASLSPTTKMLLLNIAGVLVSAGVTFGVATLLMIFKKENGNEAAKLNFTDDGMTFENNIEMSSKKDLKVEFNWENAKKLYVCCDSGMGSSAMAAGILRQWAKKNNIEITISSCAITQLPPDADICVTVFKFKEMALEKIPNGFVYPLEKFLGPGVYDDLQNKLLKYKSKKEENYETK